MYENFDYCPVPEDQIASRECRFSIYIPGPTPEHPDLHYIKEVVHTKDGRSFPNVSGRYDEQFPFWITRKGFRNHRQHKEWERLERLQEFRCPRRFQHTRIAAALGKPWLRDLRACLNEPSVYGVDISTTAVIKREYQVKWAITPTPYTICELDIEANVVDGSELPTILSISMPPTYGAPARCYTYVTKAYASARENFIEEMEAKTQELITPLLKTYRETAKKEIKFEPPVYDIDYKCEIVKDDMELWIKAFEQIHKWEPDFLSIFNVTYEMNQLLASCERYGVDPRDFMNDPRLPREYRPFDYIEGKPQKVTASGKKMPIKPAARWHHVEIAASFFIIDQMCAYKQTRMGEQEEQSYALDALMRKELKLSKLHVPEADHIPHATLEWHRYMQKHHPIEYCVYNRFDVIGPQLLDEKVKDLSMVLPTMAATSDFKRFPSQPRRTCDNLHWHVLALPEPRVMGVTPHKREDEEFDVLTISRDDWMRW